MTKIKVMVEKEIDIEELTTCLRHQLTQDGAYEAALVIETLYKQVEELEQHCDIFKEKSENLSDRIGELNENARKQIIQLEKKNKELKERAQNAECIAERINGAKYLFNKLRELNPCMKIQPKESADFYIDKLLDMYRKLDYELARQLAFKKCPDCFGRQYDEDTSECSEECVHRSRCKEFYEEQNNA